MKTELLAPAKSDYLLDAPLEILHEESLEWLNDIEFWRDETAFLYKLIIQKSKEGAPLLKTKKAKDAERHLIHISVEKLGGLNNEVKEHEKFLSRFLEFYQPNEELYRTRHKELKKKFTDFEIEFREMKRKIFQLAAKWNPIRVVRAKNNKIQKSNYK